MFTGLGSLINEPRAGLNCRAKKGRIAVAQKQPVFRTLRYQKLSGQKRPFLAQVGKCDNPTRILTVGVQRLHHFPSLETTPEVIVNHVKQCLQLDKEVRAVYDRPKTMYRPYAEIRVTD